MLLETLARGSNLRLILLNALRYLFTFSPLLVYYRQKPTCHLRENYLLIGLLTGEAGLGSFCQDGCLGLRFILRSNSA